MLDKVAVSHLCEELGLRLTVFYPWQNVFYRWQKRVSSRMERPLSDAGTS
jgi:hypothetical protein